jgi:Phytoene dehydrogenase and related proteins
MTERFKHLLKDIFKKKILPNDFSLYIHRPTATDKSFAPDGCDSFYVLCPVPNLQGKVDWDKESSKLKNRIISELSKTIMPNLEETITDIFWMNPKDFKKDYRSMYGSGFSIAPIFTQSAWFRYHNKDSKIKNLYFSAAGSHPGAGIPGVLSSAKVVENIIKNDFKL